MERFWERVKILGRKDCWEWSGSLRGGYGRVFDSKLKKNVEAHRMSWKIKHGRYPKKGLLACHTCDNRKCVNPAHIFLGTHSENAQDSVRKGRHHLSNKKRCKRGHLLSGDNVYNSSGRRHCRKCRTLWMAKYRRHK